MTKGPRYRRAFRRRSTGKTNYQRRLKFLKSNKLRIVARASNNHILIQVVQSKLGGDKIISSAFSKELKNKYGWKANTGNIPAAYLTGYLAGLRAKKQNITEAILDLGILYHRNRLIAASKGVIDAGLEVPYNEDFFPENLKERIEGQHIEKYAKGLKDENPEKYEKIFSGYLNNDKINPLKISQMFSTTLKSIESKP
ncbi:MAG: 50S ribosomal protein L18 [Candidatus Heimdallarchaeota archaeon]